MLLNWIRFCVFSLAAVTMVIQITTSYVYANEPERKEELISTISTIMRGQERDPRALSEMAKELGQYRYSEVKDALLFLLISQLKVDRPNTYILNAALTSLGAMGNTETLEELKGINENLIDGKVDSRSSIYVLQAFQEAKHQMTSHNHILPSLYGEADQNDTSRGDKDNIGNSNNNKDAKKGRKLEKEKREGESYGDWIKRLMMKGDPNAQILDRIASHILNDQVQARQGEEHSFSVFGREKETQELAEKLARFKARSPVLVGPAGAGKTTVVLKLAEMIEKDQINPDMVFDNIRNCIILETTPAAISTLALSDNPTAQAQALEQFLEAVEEFQKQHNQKIIVFIDELHNLHDAQVEALKPALDSHLRDIRFIGATTHPEFELKFKHNNAAQRRFSLIPVKEFTKEQMMEILEKSWYPILKEHFNVEFSREATEAIVNHSISVQSAGGPIDTSIKTMQDMAIHARSMTPNQKTPFSINEDNAYKFIQEKTDLPADPKDGPQFKSFLDQWRTELNQEILGQEKAIESLTRNLSLLFFDEEKRVSPVILLGPTGVGKTALANAIARVVFKNPQAVLEVDANSLKTGGFSMNSLLGAPNGVISSDKTSGRLMEWLEDPAKGKQGGVLIINEAERASTDFWEGLMEFFDKGVITGGDGRTRTVNNILVILTSNQGHEILYPEGIHAWSEAETQKHLNGFSQKDLRELFAELDPSVLGRVDELVATNIVNKELAKRIAQKTIGEWIAKYEKNQNIQIVVSEDFIDKLMEMEFNILEGARPIKRRVHDALNRVREASYDWKLQRGDSLHVSLHQEGRTFRLHVAHGDKVVKMETPLVPKLHPLDDPEFKKRVENLDQLNKLILGQEELVQAVKDAVLSHYSSEKRLRPLSLAFVGPTGLGKTELIKALAKIWFGSESRSAIIPVGNIQYRGQLNNIFGSPKGHVGSEDISLFEKALIDNAQGGVIAFDEFSNMGMAESFGSAGSGKSAESGLKATLLQDFYPLMDEGKFKSIATGKVYDLSKYILIFTGNDGERIFEGLPYDLQQQLWKKFKERQEVSQILRNSGATEAFLGRLSDILLFKPLSPKSLYDITEKFLAPLREELRERHVELTVEEGFIEKLSTIFFLPEKGARSIRSFVDDILMGHVNKVLLKTQDQGIRRIHLEIHDREDKEDRENREVLLKIEAFSENSEKPILREGMDVTHKAAQKTQLTPEMIQQVATHEAGHAIVGHRLQKTVELISIRSGKGIGGFVSFKATEGGLPDRLYTIYEVATTLGGRQSEVEIGAYSLNLGWSSDLKQIQEIIKKFTTSSGRDKKLFNKSEAKGESEQIFKHAQELASSLLIEERSSVEDLRDLLIGEFTIDRGEFKAFMRDQKEKENQRSIQPISEKRSEAVLKKIQLLIDLDAALWSGSDDFLARFVREKLAPTLRELSQAKINKASLEEDVLQAVSKLIKQGETETIKALITEVFTQEDWKKHAALLRPLVRTGHPEILQVIRENLPIHEQWFKDMIQSKDPKAKKPSRGGNSESGERADLQSSFKAGVLPCVSVIPSGNNLVKSQ